MSIFKRFINFYRSSAENKTQVRIFLGFVVIPVIGMTTLYILVKTFWL